MAKTASKVLKLTNVRLSFAAIDKPKGFPPRPGETPKPPKFQGTALLDPATKEHAALIEAIKAEATRVAKEKWGDNVETKKLVLCFGKGDKKAVDEDGEVNETYAAYKGKFFLAAASELKPLVANRAGRVIEKGDPSFPYSGCYVNMNVTLYAWDYAAAKRKGISAELRSLQYVSEGEAFGRGPVDPEDEFEPLPEGEGSGATESDDFD